MAICDFSCILILDLIMAVGNFSFVHTSQAFFLLFYCEHPGGPRYMKAESTNMKRY